MNPWLGKGVALALGVVLGWFAKAQVMPQGRLG